MFRSYVDFINISIINVEKYPNNRHIKEPLNHSAQLRSECCRVLLAAVDWREWHVLYKIDNAVKMFCSPRLSGLSEKDQLGVTTFWRNPLHLQISALTWTFPISRSEHWMIQRHLKCEYLDRRVSLLRRRMTLREQKAWIVTWSTRARMSCCSVFYAREGFTFFNR